MLRLACAVLCLSALILPASCGSQSDSPSESGAPVEQQMLGDTTTGLELYDANCRSCHGPLSAGDIGTKDKRDFLEIIDRSYHRKVFAELTIPDRDAIFELLAGSLPTPEK